MTGNMARKKFSVCMKKRVRKIGFRFGMHTENRKWGRAGLRPWVLLVLAGALGLTGSGMALADGEPDALETFVSPSTQMEFVKIPAGCYAMGDDQGYAYERPAHRVCVGSFFLGRYEVTQKQWGLLMEENRSRFLGENLPVQRVSWEDAREFIRRLNEREGTDRYRLPTEAEWERAARAGTQTRYYWGDEIDNAYVWFYGSAGFTMHPVGTRRPNAFGLYDMLGSVWEWVSDWYDSKYYSISPRDNPTGPATGRMRVRRGGSIANLSTYVRCASRYRDRPGKRHYILGFRVARSP